MDVAQAEAVLAKLYEGVEPYKLSHGFRNQLTAPDQSLIYGEVLPHSFLAVLEAACPPAGGVFYDLGSGTGRALVLASLGFSFSKVVGVERVTPLVEASREALARLAADGRPLPRVEHRNQDMLETDFSDADIVFAHSACYTRELMKGVVARCEAQLKPGAKLIAINKTLRSKRLKRLTGLPCEMDWGPSLASVYESV